MRFPFNWFDHVPVLTAAGIVNKLYECVWALFILKWSLKKCMYVKKSYNNILYH